MNSGELRTLRLTRLDWTQRQAAEWCGVSENTIWRWENGRTIPETYARLMWLAGELSPKMRGDLQRRATTTFA